MSEDTAVAASQAEGDKKTAKKSTPKEASVTSTADKAKRKRYKSSHPTTIQMAIEAIEALHEDEGSSVQAIKGWICDNYHTVRPDMIKSMLRNALHKGVEKGLFVRPKKLNTTAVLTGRYTLAEPATVERPEGLRTSSRISRIQRRLQRKNIPSKKRPLSLPFGKRRKKKKKKEVVAEETPATPNDTTAETPKEKPAKGKTAKKDTVVESAPKVEEKPAEKTEKPKEEKKKSEPVKNESTKTEAKNEIAKPPPRKSRKKTL